MTNRYSFSSASKSAVSFEELSLTNKKIIAGKMSLSDGLRTEEAQFTYSLVAPRWELQRSDMPSLRVDDANEIHIQSVVEYLDANPPVLLLDDGSSVVDGTRDYTEGREDSFRNLTPRDRIFDH